MHPTVLFSLLLSLFAITILTSPLPTAQNIQRDTLDSSDANNALRQAAESLNKPKIGSGAPIFTHPKLPEMRGSIVDFVNERR